MNAIAARYRRQADAFERKIAAVRPDQWWNPTPCRRWAALDLVDHVVSKHGDVLAAAGRALRAAPSVSYDPLIAFRSARIDVELLLEHADAGLADSIDEVLGDDLVLHGWDLARSTGQDATIEPQETVRLWVNTSAALAFEDLPDKYGPAVEVPEHAPLQVRLLGLVGRDPYWPLRLAEFDDFEAPAA
ncbi:DinB family protein [Flindersiella endophytica]